ncbi:MAG: hypothetical protein IPO81_22790 [Kouleothrix sp.]|nr:hypothetical protein [Kouleothrix sp.]
MNEQTLSHVSRCPECGAPRVNGLACWDMLGAILAWEQQDRELMAEHFLTVASYNLQHPAQFTDAALAGLRAVFAARLDHDLAVEEIRRRVGKAAAGATRVLKPEAERQPALRQWAMTIAEVYLPDRPEGAAERVRAWAAAIRRELSPRQQA